MGGEILIFPIGALVVFLFLWVLWNGLTGGDWE
jgi:hypothetical protein